MRPTSLILGGFLVSSMIHPPALTIAGRSACVAALRAARGGVLAFVNPNNGLHEHEGYALGWVLLANRQPPAALVALGGRHLHFVSVRIFAVEHVLTVVAAAGVLRLPVDDYRFFAHVSFLL